MAKNKLTKATIDFSVYQWAEDNHAIIRQLENPTKTPEAARLWGVAEAVFHWCSEHPLANPSKVDIKALLGELDLSLFHKPGTTQKYMIVSTLSWFAKGQLDLW